MIKMLLIDILQRFLCKMGGHEFSKYGYEVYRGEIYRTCYHCGKRIKENNQCQQARTDPDTVKE